MVALAVLVNHFEHGQHVLDGRVGLDVVDGAEDEAAAGAEDLDPLADLVVNRSIGDVLGAAVGVN